jgi:hypothetical protein
VVTVLRQMRQRPTTVTLSERTTRILWIVAVLDMMAVAWMIAAGDWLDQKTSGFAEVITLGGHHRLVLILAAVGFVMLAGLAVLTDGFYFRGPAGDRAHHDCVHDLRRRIGRCHVGHPAARHRGTAAGLRRSAAVSAVRSLSVRLLIVSRWWRALILQDNLFCIERRADSL